MTHRIRFGTSRCQCSALVEWEIPTGDWYRGGSFKRFLDQGTRAQHICHASGDAIAGGGAQRWSMHIDYIPEGVAIPARTKGDRNRPSGRAEAASSFTATAAPRLAEPPPPAKSLWETVSE